MKKKYESVAIDIVQFSNKRLLTDSRDEMITLPGDEFEEEE